MGLKLTNRSASKIERNIAHAAEIFRSAMADAGVITDDPIIPDGVLRRIHIDGHRRGTRNGAYILHAGGHPAGWFTDWKAGVSGTWRYSGDKWCISAEDQRQIEDARRDRQRERVARQNRTALRAESIFSQAAPAVSHPYLIRKAVRSYGLKIGSWTKNIQDEKGWLPVTISDALFVPLIDQWGKIWNLQAIFPDSEPLGRNKDFMSGGRKAGLFYPIGDPSDAILLCEGYATGATLYERTGKQTIIAFDCGNLLPVAKSIRSANPKSEIIVCADNDRFTTGNPGLTKAREAAVAVGGLVSAPEFPEGVTGSDWNDYYLEIDYGRN